MGATKVDFFISYNEADRKWAEWIAWQLESSNYTTILQAWDFRPGSNFVQQMQLATSRAERIIAVLSQNYLSSNFTQPEWQTAFARDPTGANRFLIPVRVSPCDPEGLLPQIVYIDLVELDESASRDAVLNGVSDTRSKPPVSPIFPGNRSVPNQPPFPGDETRIDSFGEFQIGEEIDGETKTDEGGGVATIVGTQGIELHIDRDFDSYQEKEKQKLLNAIRNLLEIDGDIVVISKKRKSVLLTLELTPEQAERLYWAVKSGDFSEFGVVDAELVDILKEKGRRRGAVTPPSAQEVYSSISETTGVSKRDVAAVFEALNDQIKKALSGRGGSRTFTIHGLAKIVVQHKPATEERQGVNPFTGEPTTFKAKPARNIVKVRPLKKLKDMVS